ncbi:hypothetical protein [Glycomyces buryatensis]|uniref:Uncharacterized protein n=1 Tax=Glycomyces buryatensis TaxID=2570927 RepID=A0A4S8QHH5_9ACTN|nr:hypothetical protein [Glycomyces buryatensis]THV42682.1 hypothetical protein FAB82_05830 [Glycomyces buryatensis]
MFAYADMNVEVQSIRSEVLAYEVLWLRRVDSKPEVTIAVRRPTGIAVANLFDLEPAELDSALSEFLKRRSDSV